MPYRGPIRTVLCLLAGPLCMVVTWVLLLWSSVVLYPLLTIAFNVGVMSLLAYGWLRARRRGAFLGYLLLASTTVGYLLGVFFIVQLLHGFTVD
ncbi:MAG TPA: hypothetical protein VLL08_08105 [Kineosporiaceae bacterium]|nr:hypothetical protein [Kineosporiaceae bacterium]